MGRIKVGHEQGIGKARSSRRRRRHGLHVRLVAAIRLGHSRLVIQARGLLLLEGLVVPAPLLLELLVDKANAPSRLLLDLLEDGEHFFLLAADDEALGGNGEGAERHAGHAAVFDVGDDAADLARV